MSRRDFTEPPSIEERIQGAFDALKSMDLYDPSAEAVAKLAGVPVETVEQWLNQRRSEHP